MSGELRIGDKEREAAVAALGEHYAAGRIDKEEYDERSAVAWEARTTSALAPLFADLPDPHATPSKTTIARGDDRTASVRRARPGSPAWAAFAGVVLIALLVTLAVFDEIPWFVAAIAAWIVWMKATRFGRRRQRHGHWHSHPGWGRSAGW